MYMYILIVVKTSSAHRSDMNPCTILGPRQRLIVSKLADQCLEHIQ